MLDQFKPTDMLLALWPTGECEFPGELEPFAQRLQTQFPVFVQRRVLQAPAGAPLPPDLPRLALVGEKNRWVLELAPQRVSLRLNNTQASVHSVAEMFDLFGQMLGPLQAWLAENMNLKAYRLGLIFHLFCNTRASANQKVAQYFLQPRALQGQQPHEIQLGIHARVPLGEAGMVNRWLRVKPLRTTDPRHLDFAAQVELDLNTLVDDTRLRTAADIQAFLKAACKHILSEVPLLHDPEFLL